MNILELFIKLKYGNVFNDAKIKKLAQENARYFVTVFMPTQMIYTTSLRQINYFYAWMHEWLASWICNEFPETPFYHNLENAIYDFYTELNRLNVISVDLATNEKYRMFSLMGKDLDKKEEHFGDVYATLYKGSFAELAQAQRHRTLDYQMELLDEKEYFVPPIIRDNDLLVAEWLNDMESVKDVTPQGELVKIYETGSYENFILKCKERLCTAAQLEVMQQTRDTLLKYQQALKDSNSYLASDIERYTHGARCTFGYECTTDCKFKEGKTLKRQI